MADLNRGLGATYDQRVADRLADARKSSGIIERFGESAMDRLKGAASAGGYGLMGLTTDMAGGLGSFLGGPFSEDAATLEAFSDEAYRRAVPLLTEGYTKGSRTAAKDAVPMFSFEDKLLRGQYEQDVADARREASLNMPSDGTGRPMEIQEQIDIFQALNPDAGPITAEQINQLSKGKNLKPFPVQPKKRGLKPFSEGVIEQEQIQADANREASLTMPSGTEVSASSVAPSMETMDEMDAASNLFIEALADTKKAKGEEPVKAKTREEMLEKYKQEFADATGIDISGKPDTSQALMAMGLSMMQNRAGKGFNVGKMLSAVGEAGEKVMPYVAKAASEAKAASAAAGKYALGRIQAGEASAAAFAKEVRAHNNAWNLEVMKQRSAIEQKRIEGGGKVGKLENKEKFKIGAGDITIATGTFKDDKYGERPVFVNGAADAGKITDAYKKYTEGQEYVVNMQDSLTALANRPEGPLPAKLIDSIKTFSVKLGLADPKAAFGEEGVSEAEQFQVYRQATINAFKKLILQESQVSNLDLTTLFASFGEDGFMASPEKAKLAIDTMMDYFSAKKRTLQAPLSNMTERDWFQTETDYNRTQKLLSGIGISSSSPVATTDGSRYTLDLTAIPKLNETG